MGHPFLWQKPLIQIQKMTDMKQTIRLSIPGMKCNGCVAAIEEALEKLFGVHEVTVDLATKAAVLVTTLPPSKVIDTVKSAGFAASLAGVETQDSGM